MKNASEWLQSFSSQYHQQVKFLMKERKSNQNRTITASITGGKGGVGKTSISLKMAKELSSLGFKTLLIDCDYNLSNTAIKLGLPVDNTFYSLLTAQKSFEDCVYQDGNFHLLSACNGSLELFDTSFRFEEIIIDIINAHENEYDFILLDCPAGLSRSAITLNAYCDQRIFVVTPDRASITDSYSLVKVLNLKFGIKENHLIVNMYQSKSQFEKVVKTLSETVENFLGGRTLILGGIQRINVDQSTFDTFFLEKGNNELQKNFSKVVNKYTDELGRSFSEGMFNPSLKNQMFEQEVH